MNNKKLKIIFFTESARGACGLYRAWLPCLGLNSKGHYARYSQEWKPAMLKEFDLFVFQRNSVKETVELIYAIRKSGKPVIYDLDDNLLQIPMSNPVYWVYLENPGVGWYQFQSMIQSSCMTVTTKHLTEVYGGFKKAHIIPNYLNIEEHMDATPIRIVDDKILLFWGGSNTHRECLMLLRDVLPTILDEYPNVGLVLMGDQLPFEADWSRIYEVPWGKYRFFKMAMLGCDIGLAPLAPNAFNLGKSDLRIKELAAAKLPIVASDYGEYAGSTRAAGGLVATTSEEWLEHLSRLIEDESERRYRSGLAWDWAQKQDIRLNIDHTIGTYRQILEDEHLELPDLGEEPTGAPTYSEFEMKRDASV